jgi:hypothetical protein
VVVHVIGLGARPRRALELTSNAPVALRSRYLLKRDPVCLGPWSPFGIMATCR